MVVACGVARGVDRNRAEGLLAVEVQKFDELQEAIF